MNACPYHVRQGRMSKKTVVIVGGGIAGLAAANTLQCSGRYEVHLLEGSSRLGGRIKTVDFPKVRKLVPLGGQYFHGEATNSLYQLARKLEFVVEKDRSILSRSSSEKDERRGDDSALYLLSDGTVLNTCSSFHHYSRLFRSAYSSMSDSTSPLKTNVYDHVADRFFEKMTGDAALSAAVFHCYMSVAGLYFGSTLKNIDLVLHADNEADHEDTTEYPGQPLQQIVNHLAENLPSEVIHLNSEVESIQWNQSIVFSAGHPITVQCRNGLQYSADHVILTVSLGVLKKKMKPSPTPFFSPPLPESKQLAITRLGFGVVCKLFFSLTEPLCDGTSFDEVLLFWKDSQLISEKLAWIKGLSLIQIQEKTGLYTAWFGGENAIAVEQLTNAELKEGLKLVIEIFFKKFVDVDSTICTHWYSDPLYRGSYSYAAAGSTSSDRGNLSSPLDGSTPLQLLFAGEATHPTHFSTAQAAYDSGIKEAMRIIDLPKSNKLLAKC